MLHVLSDILEANDRGDVAVLGLLDLSAAFDKVDHDILLRRLQQTYGINGKLCGGFSRTLVVANSPFDVEVAARIRLLQSAVCLKGQCSARYCSCSTLLILLSLFRNMDWSRIYMQMTLRPMGGRLQRVSMTYSRDYTHALTTSQIGCGRTACC